jgi:tryptophan synthase beta chain
MGLFYPFLNDQDVKMYGVEAAGLALKQANTQRH